MLFEYFYHSNSNPGVGVPLLKIDESFRVSECSNPA